MLRCKHFLIPLLNVFLVFGLLLFGAEQAQATHALGADLTYACTGNPNEYRVTLNVYRDCNGVNLPTTQTVSWRGSCGSGSARATRIILQDITPICPSQTSSCGSGSGAFGVEQHTYEVVITVPSNCTDITFSWRLCCRNNAITTLNGNPAMYVETRMLNHQIVPCNNSPIFLNPPAAFTCRGNQVFYNHGAIDPDNDSLRFSLVPCLQNQGSNVSYRGGFSGQQPFGANLTTIDPATGAITFTPTSLHVAVLCVLVEEYRNGVLIGSVMRDIQFRVLNCNNVNPVVSGIDSAGITTTNYAVSACFGQQLCFDVIGSDPGNPGDNLSMNWDGGIPGATFTVSPPGVPAGNQLTGTFCWTPSIADVGTYRFTVTIQDDACPLVGSNTFTYIINIISNPNDPVDAGPDQQICRGSSANLNATTTAANVVRYVWSPVNGLSNPNIANPVANPTVTTNYVVTAIYADSCTSTDQVRITVVNDPALSLAPNNINVCGGSPIVLTATTDKPGLRFEFTELPSGTQIYRGPGAAFGPTATVPVTVPSAPGIYQWAVTVTDTITGCTTSDIISLEVGAAVPVVACRNIYVSTTGIASASGSQFDPVTLEEALRRSACNNSVIKVATGNYDIDNPLNITSSLTVEGGFIQGQAWLKTSEVGATTINRTTNNAGGVFNLDRHLTAIEVFGSNNFRLQDLTVTTADAITTSTSTYGIFMNNPSNYNITRLNIVPGAASVGSNGDDGCDGQDGDDGTNGIDALPDVVSTAIRGGRGGNAGNFGDPNNCTVGGSQVISGGLGGRDDGAGNSLAAVTGGTNPNSGVSDGSGGGGGGQGGAAANGTDGAASGNPGAPRTPPAGCSATNTGYRGVSAAGGIAGTVSTTPDGVANNNGTLPTAGDDGTNGLDGCVGADGPAGTFVACRYQVGAQATTGMFGSAGSGGGGGGGGGGQTCPTCADGTGGGGGGGAGGAGAGTGGEGGFGGGASFGIYLCSNGANGFIEHCFVDAGTSGAGGIGGAGGVGGQGGAGGAGGASSAQEVQAGANGGNGGDGGAGGQGGNGQPGISVDIFWDGNGTVPVAQDSTYELFNQQIIFVENTNCTNAEVMFWDSSRMANDPRTTALPQVLPIGLPGTTVTNWVFDAIGLNSIPATRGFNADTTRYNAVGRYSIVHNTCLGCPAAGGPAGNALSEYRGFHNIAFDKAFKPDITSSANVIGLDTFQLCVGDFATFSSSIFGDTTRWEFNGAITDPGNVQNVPSTQFNTPGFYEVQLFLITDCCGDTPTDTVYLFVDPIPTPTGNGDQIVCLGDTATLSIAGLGATDSIVWSPMTTINVVNRSTVEVFPSTTTLYTASVYSVVTAGGQTRLTCPVAVDFNVTVNPLPTPVMTATAVVCNDDGTATATPSTGSTYNFVWATFTENGVASSTATNLAAGTYCVTVTDVATGCVDEECIFVPPAAVVPTVFANNIVSITCFGANDGAVTIGTNNGTAPFTYVWDTIVPGIVTTTSSNYTVNNLAPRDYTVTSTDANGCISTTTFNVPSPDLLTIAIIDTIHPICQTDSGRIEVEGQGGTGLYNYNWSNGQNGPSGILAPIDTGFYCVTVTDENNCEAIFCINLDADQIITTAAVVSDSIDCTNGTACIAVNAAGAGGAYTYSWSGAGITAFTTTTDTACNFPAGIYTVVVTDNTFSCTATETVTVTEPPLLVATITAQTNVNCFGTSTGQATVSGTGGTPAYSFEWDANAAGQTTPTATGLIAGVYQVSVTDSKLCQTTTSVTITQPNSAVDVTASITSDFNGTDISCFGASDGQATAVGSGGTPGAAGYGYVWNNAQTTAIATNLPFTVTPYSVVVTDSLGCQDSTTVLITQPTRVVASISSSVTVSCFGDSTGTATAVGTGGTGVVYDFAWNDGQTTATAINLAAIDNPYLVVVTDSNNCQDSITFNVQQPGSALTSGAVVVENANCFGTSDGVATASGSGGTAPISFLWDANAGNAPTATVTGLAAGVYCVTVSDANSCSNTHCVTITEPTAVTATITNSTNVSCNTGTDGTATVAGSGGNTGTAYTFLWDNAQTTATAINLAAGVYSVTVSDDSSCIGITSVTITEPNQLVATASVTSNINGSQVSCPTASDGSVTAVGTDGTAPYTFVWNTGNTGATQTGLDTGLYIVTITDSLGCIALDSVTIVPPAPVVLTIDNSTNVACTGDTTGTATVTASGGSGAPYSYIWDDGTVGAVNNSLPAGNHCVTATDINNCPVVICVPIAQPDAVVSTTMILDSSITCDGFSNGGAHVQAAGGTPSTVAQPNGTGYTYNWSNSSVDTFATGLAAGSYQVTVTDSLGCTAVDSIDFTAPTAVVAIAVATQNVDCFGDSTGQALATGSGGTPTGTAPNYTFNWDNGQTTATATGLPANTPQQVTVTDANGCSATASVSVSQPNSPVVATATINTDYNGQDVSCNGAIDGEISVTGTGGTATTVGDPYNYVWTTTATNDTLTVGAGTYSVTVTDSLGCADSATIVVGQPALVTATINNQVNVNCFGTSTGSAEVIAGGGTLTTGYSYVWDNGTTTTSNTNLPAGVECVTVTDNNGCFAVACATITQPSSPVTVGNAVVNSNVTCNGQSQGSITVAGAGGTPGTTGVDYTYAWTANANGQTTATITNLTAGTYCVTITDALGCTVDSCIIITQPTAVDADVNTFTNVSCFGGADGTATATATGGTNAAGYSFQWSANAGGGTNATVTNLSANVQYCVTVTDDNGCEDTACIILTQPTTAVAVSATQVSPVTCAGASDGVAVATGTGGTGVIAYTWDAAAGNATTDTVRGLAAGVYCVTATDVNGCLARACVTITQPTPIVISVTSTTDVVCTGDSTGEISIGATGGTAPFGFLWGANANNNTTSTIAGLAAGTYCVTVTDAAGCEDSICVTIVEPNSAVNVVANVISNYNGSQIRCFGDSSGVAVALATGGTVTTDYQYRWSITTQTSDTAVGLPDGLFCVTATDDFGCTDTACVVISEPTPVTATITATTDVTCLGDCSGVATVAANGGIGTNYTFLWDAAAGNQTTATATGLCAGLYGVTVTDQNGCIGVTTVTIIEPTTAVQASAIVSTNYSGQDVSCNNAFDGAATATATGGSGPYSFQWNGAASGQTTATATGLGAGIRYCVTITDALGCIDSTCIILTEPTAVLPNIDTTIDVTCFGDSTGSATVSATGGVAPYQYQWDAATGGQTTSTAINLPAGSYTVTVTDANLCIGAAVVVVGQPSGILDVTASVTSSYPGGTALQCFGDSSGSALATISGGSAPYTQQWNHGPTTLGVNNLAEGTYCLTVIDALGCSDTACVTLVAPTATTIALVSSSDASCVGGNDGQATVVAGGGIPGYTYLWDAAANTQTTATATGLSAGTYGVTATDANGCQIGFSVTIGEPANGVVASISQTLDITCAGAADGQVVASAIGGTTATAGQYDYLWSTGITTDTLSNIVAGTYCVTVSDDNGCTDVICITIGEPTQLNAVVTTTNDVNCFGDSTGSATVTATGGTAPFQYIWSANAASQTNATANNLPAGSYTVTVTDANGCIAQAITVINEPIAGLAVGITTTTLVQCFGDSSGAAQANITGGTAPYIINWNQGTTTTAVTGLAAGTYCVVITDANGCIANACVTLAEPAAITATTTTTPADCQGAATGTATIVAAGGTAPFNYQWDVAAASQTTATATGLAAGTYGVTVTDDNGCSAGFNVTITEPASSVVATINQTQDVTCAGATDAQIVASAIGGTTATAGQYNYTWDVGITTDTLSNIGAGIYCVSVSDDNGCTDVICITITEPSQLTGSIVTVTDVACAGDSTGSATVSATGGTAPYTYTWSANANSQVTATASNLAAGSYTVTIEDDNGCIAQTIAVIGQPTAALALGTSTTAILCAGDSSGTAQVTITGGTAPYTTNWNHGPTTANITGLPDGTYCVTVVDANGCTLNTCVTLVDPAAIAATVTTTDADCRGGATGTATVTGTGGATPYTYQWDANAAGQTTATATGLAASTSPYQVTVTDGNGCTTTASAVIGEPATNVNVALVTLSSYNGADVSCNGATDAVIGTSVTGGSQPYIYLWDNGTTNDSLTGVGVGPYCATVTDANGCTVTDCITITEPSAVTATAVSTDATCFGTCDGTATVTGTGGTAISNYTVQWDAAAAGQTTATAINLCAGSYNVTITDNNGCQAVAIVLVGQPTNALAATITATSNYNGQQISCTGASDGELTVAVTGGTLAYSFAWSSSTSTTNVATGLSVAGNPHCVTVTDANGCSVVSCFNLVDPTLLTAAIDTQTNVSCNGGANGTATILPNGGTGAYTYIWDNNAANQTTARATGLAAGAYCATVSDANNCQVVVCVNITEPTVLTTIATVASNYNGVNVSCAGSNDGVIFATPTGGTLPYSYAWSVAGAGINDTITNAPAGTSSVLVTDANGCTATASVILTEPTPVIATITASTDATCNGQCDGTATVSGAGGTLTTGYTFAWSANANGQTTATVSNLCAGTYSVTVTDNNGCTNVTSVVIDQPLLGVSATATITSNYNGADVSCFNSCDGEATAVGAGGTVTTGYTFLWSNSQTTATATGLCGDSTYSVTISDNGGCSNVATVTLSNPDSVAASISSTVDVSCGGGSDGQATVTATGGTTSVSGYAYQWDATANNQTTATAINLPGGVGINVTVTDNNGCSDVVTVTITQPSNLLLVTPAVVSDYNGQDISCNGVCDAAVAVQISGGVPAYNFTWSNGLSTDTISNLCAGTYVVTVTDNAGCTVIDSVTVVEPAVISASIITQNNVSCTGGADACVEVQGAGGTPGYTYAIQPGVTQANNGLFCNLAVGTYVVSVTDLNFCETTVGVTITQPSSLPTVNAAITSNYNGQDVSCFGACDASITATPAGGTAPYTYSWSSSTQTTQTVTGFCAGTYSVLITDSLGCTASAVVTVTEPTQLTGNLDATTNVPCFGDSTGTATFSVAGGTAPYTYAVGSSSVTTASTTATVTGIGAGGNTATVTDANGCVVTIPFIISSPPLLTATATVTSSYANGTVISCNGACDGAATAVGAGGNPGSTYTFLWSDPLGQNTFTATNLCAGTYTVSITDQNGCTAIDTVTLVEPAAITATSTQVNVSCFGDSTGSILIAATPGTGTPNYTYSLGAVTNATGLFTNLTAGTYCITITDANNCTAVECITITETPAIQTTTLTTSNYNGAGTSCFSAADGSVMVNVTGGQAGYTYQWSTNPVQLTAMATNLPGGTYFVTVTDALGCVAVDSVVLTPADSLVLDVIDTVYVACFGQPTGSFTVAASGGVAPYLYSFDGGLTFTNTVQYTNLPANMVGNGYCVIVRDANGCETTTCIRINEPTQLQGLANTITMVSCFGGADGFIGVMGVGGNPPYLYSFNGGSYDTTRNFTGLAAGNYTINVQDSLGCIFSMTNQLITEPAVLVLTLDTLRNPTCTGNCDGVIELSATGGTAGYDFSIDGVNYQVSGIFSGLCAGGYTVYVRDAQGCITPRSVILTQPTPIVPNAAVTSFYPASPALIQFNVSCNGACDGSAIATPSGGTASTPGTYTYQWSVGGATTRAVTGLCAGITYTVTVTDENGCTAVDSVILNEPTPLVGVYTQVTNETCAGDDDGVIGVTAISGSGVGPYSYDIGSGPSNNGVFTNLTGSVAGTLYSVTITDANGCTAILDTLIYEPNSVVVTNALVTTDYNGFDVSCFGATDGAVTATFTGGTAPITYLWDVNTGAQQTAIATNLGVGTYCVTLTDANGCTADTCVTVTGPTPLVLTTTVIDAGCNGTNDGSITAVPVGGTGNYTYSIDGITYGPNPVFSNLSAGTYTIYLKDDNDCGPVQQIVTVGQGAPINITTNVLTPFNGQALACAGDNNATAIATATGGAAGSTFSYLWDAGANNQATATATNLSAGQYFVTVTDNTSGCTAIDTVVVTEPTPVAVVQTTIVNVDCGNGATGAVQVSASGGTPGYTYDISAPGQAPNTTGIFTNLTAGTYTVTATDVNNCVSTVNVTITSAPAIAITLSADNVTCSGSADGQVVANVIGGTPSLVGVDYTYNWTGPNGNIVATDTVANVGPGRYFLTVQDSVGCIDTASITVLEPLPIVVTSVNTAATCGNNDGTITLSATGGPSDLNGTPNNYEYSIDGGATFVTSNTFTNLPSGFYDIVVRDAGVTYCIGLYNVDLGSNSDLTGTITSVNPACDNLNSGSATVFATSPAGGYVYNWFTDLSTFTISSTATLSGAIGNVEDVDGDGVLDTVFHYIVVVTDANGCEYRDSAYIIVPERPTIGINVGAGFTQDVDCFDGNNGVIQIGVDGDTTGFTYFWSTGATTSSITGLSTMGSDSALYYVTVTDATGCVASDTIAIFQPEDAVTAFYTGSTVSCANQATGTITLDSINGGTAPYLFSFGANGPYGSDAILTQGLRAGIYTVYTQDLNGCIDSVENVIVRDTIDYQVTAYQDQTINLGDSVLLYGSVNSTLTGADSALVSWSQLDPNTGLRSTVLVGPDALIGFTPPIFYTDMQFILSLNNGCGDSSIVTIEVNKQQTVFIPDAFSPNGDGTNDIFTIYGSTDVERVVTFMVFDRWGEMVHIGEDFEPSSIDPDNGWDGTFRGQAMNPAVFVYYAEIELANGEKVIRKGDVTLVR